MKSRKSFYIWISLVLVIVAIWFIRKPETNIQPQPMIGLTKPSIPEPQVVQSNAAEIRPQFDVADTRKTRIQGDIEARDRQSIINKESAIDEAYNIRFKQPRSFYGKVIDQDGQPVVGAEVTGNIEELGVLSEGLHTHTFKTESDSNGLFEFVRKTGAPISVSVKKDGYLLGARGEGYNGPPSEKTSSSNRAILTMWKLRGAEPLVGFSIDSQIAYNGTPTTFDSATQKINPDGDLRVTLVRSPSEVRRSGQGFDWSVKIELIKGGLVAEDDPYPYWAPENGYNPAFAINMSSNNVSWFSHLTQNFYIKNSRGQYGRMKANVYTALTPARIQFDFTINPSGSQNLEPDQSKQPQ